MNYLLQKRSPQPASRRRPRRSRGTPHTLRYCGSVTCKSSSVVFRLSRHQRPKTREKRRECARWLFPRCCRRSKLQRYIRKITIVASSRQIRSTALGGTLVQTFRFNNQTDLPRRRRYLPPEGTVFFVLDHIHFIPFLAFLYFDLAFFRISALVLAQLSTRPCLRNCQID